MKTKLILLLTALLAVNIQSCDNYLKETLVSDVSANAYFTNAAGLEDAVKGTYYFLKYVYSNERSHHLTAFGDTYTNGADGNYKGFNSYDATLRSDVDILQQEWQYCYKGINQANAVIGRIGAVKDMAAATVTIRTAEARFLRALFYFTLVRQWGDVPMPLTETPAATTEAPKSPESDIYSVAMIPDLQFAIANLPNTQSDYGRATKGAAEHLLGLVLLTRSYKSYAVGTDVDQAITYFTNVINNYGYALSPTMTDLWDQDKQTPAQGNKEVIFAVQNSTNVLLNAGGLEGGGDPGEGNRAHLFYLMAYDDGQPGMIRDIAGGRPFKRFRPTDYLMNLWAADRTIDNRFDLTYKKVWYANATAATSYPAWTATDINTWGGRTQSNAIGVVGAKKFAKGDTAIYIPGPGDEAKWTVARIKSRSYKVFLRNGYADPDATPPGAIVNAYDNKYFSHISKFMDPRRPSIQWVDGSRDWFVMRLADTYLLRAEAYVKKSLFPQAVADINVVRTRAAKPGQVAAMLALTPVAPTINYILDERARELDAEQCRWYDLTRTNTLVSRVKSYVPPAVSFIQDYHVRRPYPQTQLDRTLPAGSFLQNCGYPGGPACN